jgi:flagellar M-ring protein FliF
VNDTFSQIKAFYEGLEPTRRKVLIGAVALSLAGLVGVGLWSSQERYGVVYSSADPRQVQATAGALEAAGLTYRVSRDGTRLEVPSAQLGAARLEAAASGQPTGLDILGSIELGSSPQQERWYQGYALQQEIQSSINSIDVVEGSRVHIVQPDRVNFFSRDTTASASVVLQLTPGTELSRRQIAGIAEMVSGAVHGLDSSDVSLIDTAGNLLHPTSDDSSGLSVSVAERASVEEGAMQAKILQALLPMLGHPRHVAAAVTVELESTSVTRNQKAYDPDSGVPISTDLREEKSSDGSPARGVPGAESNLPEQATSRSGGTETSTLQERSNYIYSETNTVETLPAGRLRRVSTSVTVNAHALQRLVDASGGTEDVASLQRKVEEVIQGAVGFDAERGDSLEVEFIPFVEPEVEDISTLSTATWHIRQLLPSVVSGLAVILFFLFVARPLVARMIEPARTEPDEGEGEGEPVTAESGSELVERMRELAAGAQVIDSAELNRLTSSHEEPAAAVLRRWLKAS